VSRSIVCDISRPSVISLLSLPRNSWPLSLRKLFGNTSSLRAPAPKMPRLPHPLVERTKAMANRAAFLKTRFGAYAANLFVEMRNEFASTDTLSRRSRGFPDTLSPRQSGNYVGHLAAAHLRRTLPQRCRCGSGDRHPMRVTTRNTMAPCVVIGERASDFIRHGPWPLTDRSRINRKRGLTAGSCEIVQRSNLLSLRCNRSLMTGVGSGAFLRAERLHVT
jgi:hypothetical protein